MCFQQLYKRQKITKIKQINKNNNSIDFIIKIKLFSILKNLIDIN